MEVLTEAGGQVQAVTMVEQQPPHQVALPAPLVLRVVVPLRAVLRAATSQMDQACSQSGIPFWSDRLLEARPRPSGSHDCPQGLW